MDSNNPYGLKNMSSPPTFEPTQRRRSSGPLAAAQSARGQALNFVSFPTDPLERQRLDAIAQTPDDNGNVLCWRRRRSCNNPKCQDPKTGDPYKFRKQDYEVWNCPLCGCHRHCRRLVPTPNRGCYQHGGKSLTGYDLPQTKDGKYSRHMRPDNFKAEYERMREDEQLFSNRDEIALMKAFLLVIVSNYGGGPDRDLLQRMKKNRSAHKRAIRSKEPDTALLAEFDRELDTMIAEGAEASGVMAEFNDQALKIQKLIDARDRHVELERMVITSDKAWAMLGHVEETFRVGAEMIVNEVDEFYVRRQCQMLGVDYASLSSERVHELIQSYREERQQEKRRFLAYAAKRFTGLAGSSARK